MRAGGCAVTLLDLDAGTLAIETTRVVVDGRVIESDGKTLAATCERPSSCSKEGLCLGSGGRI